MRRWDWDEDEAVAEPVATPAFQLVGYMHLKTGVLRSERYVQHDLAGHEDYQPVYTGGPAVVAPLVAAMVWLAEDRSEGNGIKEAFFKHRLAAQIALGEYVELGGQIP